MLETLRNNPSLSRIFFPIYLLSDFAVEPAVYENYPFEHVTAHFRDVSERDLVEQRSPVYRDGGVFDRRLRTRAFNACSPNVDDNKQSNWFYHWMCCAGYVMPGVWLLPMMTRMSYPQIIKRIEWDDEPSIPSSWPQWARVLTGSFCARVQNRIGEEEIRTPLRVIYSHEMEFANPPPQPAPEVG